MEKEENSTKLTGWFLTLLFIYFYIIAQFLWKGVVSLFAWGRFISIAVSQHFVVNDLSEHIVPLTLKTFVIVYGIIAVYQALKHNQGAVSALRWSVVFMLGLVICNTLSMITVINTIVASVLYNSPSLLFLIIFLIYLFRAKSLRRMFPKEYRKNTILVRSAWIAVIVVLLWLGRLGYREFHRYILPSPFNASGKIEDGTVILDYATYEIPDGWHVDSIVIVKDFRTASIISDGKWLTVQSQLWEEGNVGEHLINSSKALGINDDDFVSQDETLPIDFNGQNAYVSRFVMKKGEDTVKCAFVSVFDSQTNHSVTLSLLSDSVISDKELKALMERISFTYPKQESK